MASRHAPSSSASALQELLAGLKQQLLFKIPKGEGHQEQGRALLARQELSPLFPLLSPLLSLSAN